MSAKKAATGPRSVKVEVEVPVSTQTTAERRAAEAELRTLIDKHAPVQGRLVSAMRRWLQKRLPTAHQVVYEYENLGAVVISFSPNENGYDGMVGIRATANEVKLYFQFGKGLPDPERLLQGSGQTRWILVEGTSTLARPSVTSLADEAIARNTVPFTSTGRGPVVIRSTSAKKRRKA
jgi:hypothetical protein